MKQFFRLLALLLALSTLISAFVACDDAENVETESQSVSETEEVETKEVVPEYVEKNNYGESFYLNILPDVNPPDYYWVEESENDALSESIFTRQQKVHEYLGVEVVGVKTGNFQNYITPFKTAVKNKDGSVDTLLTHVCTGVPGLITEQYLQDLANLEGVNLDADYWNSDFMDALSLGDKVFLGFSDFNILYTHVIAFNKDMMEQYADVLTTSVYDMVREYTWTLDEMIKLANLVYIDTTSDGKTPDDTFGFTGTQWVPWIGFMNACDVQIVDIDEAGNYAVSLMNEKNQEKTAILVEKLADLAKSDCSYLDYKTSAANTVPITSGRVLLNMASTYGVVKFLDYELNFGVLPYPMFDTDQKDVGYRSLQWGGYITVPSYLRNSTMVGETLDVLAFYSKDVTITFYEKLLGKQVADAPDDKAMLDIVWDSVCTDFGQTYAEVINTSLLYLLPDVTYEGSGKNLASTVRQYESSANKAIIKFVKKINAISK